jgi:hypothetical protein
VEIHFNGTLEEFQTVFGLGWPNLANHLSLQPVPVPVPEVESPPVEPQPEAGAELRKLRRTGIKQTAKHIIHEYLKAKIDVRPLTLANAMEANELPISITKAAALLDEIMKQEPFSRYYTKTRRWQGKSAPVLHKHSGVTYCPPDDTLKGLKAIPPKEATAKRRPSPKQVKEDDEGITW